MASVYTGIMLLRGQETGSLPCRNLAYFYSIGGDGFDKDNPLDCDMERIPAYRGEHPSLHVIQLD